MIKTTHVRLASALFIVFLAPGVTAFEHKEKPPSSDTASEPVAGREYTSEMRPLFEWYSADRLNLQRFYSVDGSEERQKRLEEYYRGWLNRVGALDFRNFSQAGKIDYIVFRNSLEHELRVLDINRKLDTDSQPFLPFAPVIMELEVARQQMQPINPTEAAEKMSKLTRAIEDTRHSIETAARPEGTPDAVRARKIRAARAMARLNGLRETLRTWFTFYNGYDPEFTWWVADDYRKADSSLGAYTTFLGEHVLGLRAATQAPQAGAGGERRSQSAQGSVAATGGRNLEGGPALTPEPGETGDIIGSPVGREALLSELDYEMIPYTPEQLISIANTEFAWCEAEMKKASKEMGFAEDWKKALEKVKGMYVEPGKQPAAIRDLALDAIKFIDDHELVTVPPIARDSWRMQMMSPERQLVNPFFTGGDTISVSYPTDTMSYQDKLMSMRGNNIPFSKATVFHELIPGHELQGYMAARYRPYRGQALGRSAFVTEGWSLYWELLLWDMKYQKNAPERIGALFWHMHRCARIIFSLSFHLGKMTPDECINFLVDRVGFERANAVGEVRRSFATSYGALYQAGYLLGGMQLYALHKELVDSGKMTNRQFHDAILKENYIPVEMMRADLENLPLTANYKSAWKFRGDVVAP